MSNWLWMWEENREVQGIMLKFGAQGGMMQYSIGDWRVSQGKHNYGIVEN